MWLRPRMAKKNKKRRVTEFPEKWIFNHDTFFLNSFTIWEKVLSRLPSSSKFFVLKNCKRLCGGADMFSEDRSNDALRNPESLQTQKIPEIIEVQDDKIPTGIENPDGMLEAAFQNLQDVDKALKNLAENHENDLKVMVAEVMGKVQTWISDVQEKIDNAKSELDNLKKELISQKSGFKAKNRELQNLKHQLAESEMKKSVYEKSLSGNVSSRTILNSAEPPDEAQVIPGSSSTQNNFQQQFESVATLPLIEDNQESQTVKASLETRNDNCIQRPIMFCQVSPSTIPIEQLPNYDPCAQNPCGCFSDRIGSSRICLREKDQKQAALEDECARLREENQRMLKEHADYENVIQRALLRGVASLNEDPLKASKKKETLAHSPCCGNCSSCSTKLIKDNWPPQGNKPLLLPKFDGICRMKDKTARLRKKSAVTVCCSAAGISKKPSPANMAFLLHQQQAANVCPSLPRYCAHLDNSGVKNNENDKSHCPAKYSNSFANRDIIHSFSRNHPRALDYADILTEASRNLESANHCEPCNKNKRIPDN